jgi:hypothetical protein
MKLNLNVDQQAAVLNALMQLDTHEAVTPGVENGPKTIRVPYKLGAQRKTLVKNINAIKASLAVWDQTRNAIFREHFPDVPDGVQVNEAEDPAKFGKYRADLIAGSTTKEEVDLIPFPESVIYDSNEFPAAITATLDEFGLIVA